MSLFGEAVVSIWHDIADAGRDEFYWWHLHEHMPERVAIPGFHRGRRYISVDGKPEFFTLYEAANLETLAGKDYLIRLNNPTPWTLSTVKHFENVARCTQKVRYSKGPGMGGFLLTIRFEAGDGDEFVERICAEVLGPAAALKGVVGLHLCETDLAVSDTKTKERAEREGGTEMPGWALLIEAARQDEIDLIQEKWLYPAACRALGMSGDISAALYQLEYARSKSDQAN